MKHPVLVKKDYTVYFEYVDDFIAVHCDVHNWSKSIMNKWLLDSFYLFNIQEKPLFAFLDKTNKKLIKFTKMSGFIQFTQEEVITDDGYKLVFEWKGM
jgi:hypothetical protein